MFDGFVPGYNRKKLYSEAPISHQTPLETQRTNFADTAASFDAVYQRENANHRYKIESIADAILKGLPHKARRSHFLAVGAGSGMVSEYFLNRHRDRIESLTLTDGTAAALENAKQRLQPFSDLKFIVSSAEGFQSQEMYDAIFVEGSLHHSADPVLAIRNLWEHLVPGGILAISGPNVWNPLNFVRAISTGMDWGQFFVTRANMRKELAKAGFSIVTNRVLHRQGNFSFSRKLWPFKRLEALPSADKIASLFLLVARK